MDDERKKYIDCLLADFSSLKEEIRRRATLQRFVLAAFIAVLAFTFQAATSPSGLSAYWIMGLWISSALALMFYYREGLEIEQLAHIIKSRIAQEASQILNVGWEAIFHSEVNPGEIGTGTERGLYDFLFNWILFFGVPALVTLKFICPVLSDLSVLPAKLLEHLSEFIFVTIAGVWCVSLLASMYSRHPIFRWKTWKLIWNTFSCNVIKCRKGTKDERESPTDHRRGGTAF